MVLINLNELRKGSGYTLNPLLMFTHYFGPHVYISSNLSSIEEGFRENSPRGKRALILVKNLQIKRLNPDSFDDENWSDLEIGLDEGFITPLFEITDGITTRIASWNAGRSQEYLRLKEEFGFNGDSFINIPKIYLWYIHDENRGTLSIYSIERDAALSKRKTTKDRLESLIPGNFEFLPEPSY